MRPGADRSSPIRTNLDIRPGSRCAASLWDRAANRDLHAYADPGAYPDHGAGRDFHTWTDPGTYSGYGADGLLARR